MTVYDSVILGIIEGVTEFLPVSSTAHLVLTAQLLGLKSSRGLESFNIIIQLAPILAVILIYWNKLIRSFDLWFKLAIAFIPTGIAGLLLYDYILSLFSPQIASLWIAITGIMFIAVELKNKNRAPKIENEEEISYKLAIYIGLIQAFSLVPGISRSGITTLGAMILGVSRDSAIRFSFLLAIPTMFIASSYTIYKDWHNLELENIEILLIGFLVSFIIGLLAIKTFLKIVSKYSFIPFGIYLIITAIFFFFVGYETKFE